MDLIIQQIQSEPIDLGGGGFFVLSRSSAAKVPFKCDIFTLSPIII